MPFTHYLLVIHRRTGLIHPFPWTAKHAEPFRLKFAGNFYEVDPSLAYIVKGWDAVRKKTFFSTFLDVLPVDRIGLIQYLEPSDKDGKPVQGVLVKPLERLADKQLVTEQSPFLLRVFVRSKLYTRWVRKVNFGVGVNTRLVIIMLIILLAVIAIMWMGGFYG